MAMDVVDTIRHADRLVERELEGPGRQVRLRERLREIYTSQGIEVADHVLDAGIARAGREALRLCAEGRGLAA